MIRPIKACLALALVGGISGCVDLEEDLVSSLGSSYIATPQGLNDATTAVYAQLQGWYGRGETDYTLTQLGTDTWSAGDQVSSGGAQNYVYLDDYSGDYNALAAFHGALWGWGYTTIARANLVLSQGPNTPVGGVMTEAVKQSRLAEARFLRALSYFILVQNFGPLTVLPETSTGISTEATRETEDSIYKLIISDVTDAVAKLPLTQAEYGRITKGAAQHLLAEVYLTRAYREWNTANRQADFTKALEQANAVIGSGQYSLVPDFARLWCGTMRAGVPEDIQGRGFCDLTNFVEKNSEVILSTNYSYDVAQQGGTNYDHVEYLQQYDGDPGWAAGIDRDKDRGRPFRRLRPLPYTIKLFQETMYAGQTPGPTADIVDTRFNASFQTVWHANKPGANAKEPASTCPRCTSGAQLAGNMLKDPNGVNIGPGVGSDTAIVYLMYQVTDDFRRSKAYRIAVPCTKPVTEDCGKGIVAEQQGIFGDRKYPSLKKFQDNKRKDVADLASGKDYPAFRLGETYLIAAEAAVGLNQLSVAAQNINVLRKRAACKGPPRCAVSHENDPNFLVTAGQMTLDFIMEERERETSGEHSRWMDIRRPGKAYFLNRIRTYNPYARANIQDKHYYRPIPQQQINGITGTPYPQNPGW